MSAFLGTAAMVTEILAVNVEVGLIGAAASTVLVGIWAIKKGRRAL